jgi:ABC-type Co2+ transport system permease subunit
MAENFSVDVKEIVVRVIKYVLEGLVVALAAWLIPSKKPQLEEILTVGLVAAATFSLLDLFSPSIGTYSRVGAGLGVGVGLTPVGQSLLK